MAQQVPARTVRSPSLGGVMHVGVVLVDIVLFLHLVRRYPRSREPPRLLALKDIKPHIQRYLEHGTGSVHTHRKGRLVQVLVGMVITERRTILLQAPDNSGLQCPFIADAALHQQLKPKDPAA